MRTWVSLINPLFFLNIHSYVNVCLIHKKVDILANQEQSSSENRLLALEKKFQLQADEILCLKSALAEVIRRLQSVENHQPAACE